MGLVRVAPPLSSPALGATKVKSRQGPVLLLALVIPALVAIAGGAAVAETKKASSPAQKPARASARPAAQRAATSWTSDGGAPAPSVSASGNPLVLSADAGVVEAKVLDGGTRVFKFTELDIEGRLKSPQLVYFLRRVRAEFAAGDLGHRTFMREMSETKKESSF